MAEVTEDKVSPKIKNLFNKGFSAVEHGSLEYAIDVLLQCLAAEPGFLKARKFLRAAQIQLFKQQNKNITNMTHQMILLKNLPTFMKANFLLKVGKAAAAVIETEKLLKQDPISPQFVLLFASAVEAAELPEAAVITLEVARDQQPENIEIAQRLGDIYLKAGDGKKARITFEKLAEARPNDPAIVKALKDAMAMDSLKRDGWQGASEKGGNYRELIKDTKEATLMEQEGKAVKTEKDAHDLILDLLSKIDAEPMNMNYYRSLARLYAQQNRFDDALATLTRALEVVPGDPEADAALGATRAQKYDYDIAQLRAAGDNETADAKETEKLQFVFDDLQSRVGRYPGDHKLRYEWGIALFENEYINEAIQQFQIAQKNAQFRVGSFFYIAKCFKQKGQYDLAKEQLEKALADLPKMDDVKKDVCYEMGEVLEALNEHEKALEFYKQIYQTDINYKDVAEKIDQSYRT